MGGSVRCGTFDGFQPNLLDQPKTVSRAGRYHAFRMETAPRRDQGHRGLNPLDKRPVETGSYFCNLQSDSYSVTTAFTKFLGLSTFAPFNTAK